jgi:hypothetical protein
MLIFLRPFQDQFQKPQNNIHSAENPSTGIHSFVYIPLSVESSAWIGQDNRIFHGLKKITHLTN